MVEERGNPAGLRQAPRERRKDLGEGEGCTKNIGMAAIPPPHIYRGKGEGGGAALALPPRKGAAREESLLPKAPRRCLPPLGLFLSLISWRMGLLGLVPLAHIGQGAHPYSPCGPPGAGGPTRWTPGTLPVVLVQYR